MDAQLSCLNLTGWPHAQSNSVYTNLSTPEDAERQAQLPQVTANNSTACGVLFRILSTLFGPVRGVPNDVTVEAHPYFGALPGPWRIPDRGVLTQNFSVVAREHKLRHSHQSGRNVVMSDLIAAAGAD